MVILDDSFSALDGMTEKRVVENLLGPEGVFRREKTTVLWLSNNGQSFILNTSRPLRLNPRVYDFMKLRVFSARHFHLADHVVVLKNSRIAQQGPWTNVQEDVNPDPQLASKGATESINVQDTLGTSGVSQGLIKLQAQKRAVNDIAVDIGRKSGDFSLYRKKPVGRPNYC